MIELCGERHDVRGRAGHGGVELCGDGHDVRGRAGYGYRCQVRH